VTSLLAPGLAVESAFNEVFLQLNVIPRRLLGLTVPEGVPSDEGVQLARVTGDVDAVTPERFLAHAPEAPRSFWQQGETWRAGVGAAARVVLRGSGEEADRFRRVREAAEATADALVTDDEDPGEVAWIGGFSFHSDHAASDAWRGFPRAQFTLPTVEMRHGPQGTRLAVTVRVGEDRPSGQALGRARDALEGVRNEFTTEDPRGRASYTPPTAENSTARSDWSKAVEAILGRVDVGQITKAVLARTVDAPVEQQPDPTVVLGNLRQNNPGTHHFLVQPGPGQAFLGSAPELIGRADGQVFQASAVAGSIPRGATEDEDEEMARQLAASDKNRAEHRIVVESMRRRLAELTDHVQVGRDTKILRLAEIQHLERDLYARLRPGQHLLDVVQALHPTPAVCGSPRDPARQLLAEHEPFQRGWYAAPVGWFNANGDGAFAPALRSAVLQQTRWRLFAGAGIVDGSDPDDEWEETRNKFETVLAALGVQEAPP
jgi:menaquinone-specific isochorismate synthase